MHVFNVLSFFVFNIRLYTAGIKACETDLLHVVLVAMKKISFIWNHRRCKNSNYCNSTNHCQLLCFIWAETTIDENEKQNHLWDWIHFDWLRFYWFCWTIRYEIVVCGIGKWVWIELMILKQSRLLKLNTKIIECYENRPMADQGCCNLELHFKTNDNISKKATSMHIRRKVSMLQNFAIEFEMLQSWNFTGFEKRLRQTILVGINSKLLCCNQWLCSIPNLAEP